MKLELHCMLCGAELDDENGHSICPCCGAEYANMLLSESRSEDDDGETLELSISVDCTQVKPKLHIAKLPEFDFAHAAEEQILAL